MAKMTGLLKTILLNRKTTEKMKLLGDWRKYRKEAGKQAMGLAQWVKAGKPVKKKQIVKKQKGKKIAYYGQGRETADAILRRIKKGKLKK